MSFLYLSNSLFDNNIHIQSTIAKYQSITKNHVITEIKNVPRHYLA